jgi:hypothetical protein
MPNCAMRTSYFLLPIILFFLLPETNIASAHPTTTTATQFSNHLLAVAAAAAATPKTVPSTFTAATTQATPITKPTSPSHSSSSAFSTLRSHCYDTQNIPFATGGDFRIYRNKFHQLSDNLGTDVLHALQINEKSPFNKFMAGSPIPVVANACRDDKFEINILHIPVSGVLPTRIHPSGAIIFYRQLMGESNVTSTIKERMIQQDSMSNFGSDMHSNRKSSAPIRRLGGPTRLIENTGYTGVYVCALSIRLAMLLCCDCDASAIAIASALRLRTRLRCDCALDCIVIAIPIRCDCDFNAIVIASRLRRD